MADKLDYVTACQRARLLNLKDETDKMVTLEF